MFVIAGTGVQRERFQEMDGQRHDRVRAWGTHRVVDALKAIEAIDSTKIAVTGHSRNGKAALVAGAFDERIALTIPNLAGCGGAARHRFIYGESEQLHNIVNYAPLWFRPDFDRLIDHVERLQVD